MNMFRQTGRVNTVFNKKGVTLIELLVVSGLLIIVVSLAYSFFGTSGVFFEKNTNKIDAQAQSRLIFQGLKIEIGVAKKIEIIDRQAAVVDVQAGEIAYYAENNVFSRIQSNGDTSPAFGSLSLDSLIVTFVPLTQNVLHVIITANDGTIYETEMYAPNINGFQKNPSDLMSGNALIITP